MSTRTKFLVALTILLSVIVVYLFAFTLISTSHPIAKEAIATSPQVAASVGKASGFVLLGVRQKLVPGGRSCSQNTYLVIGDSGVVVVKSGLSMQGREPDWTLNGLSIGWFSSPTESC